MSNTVKKGLVMAGVLAVATTSSFGAVDVTGVTLDVTSVEDIAKVMLGGLAVIWVARKVVNFLR